MEDLVGAMGRCRSYLRESELLPQFIDSELRIRVFFVFFPLIALSIALLVKYNPFCIFFFFGLVATTKTRPRPMPQALMR